MKKSADLWKKTAINIVNKNGKNFLFLTNSYPKRHIDIAKTCLIPFIEKVNNPKAMKAIRDIIVFLEFL